MDPNGIFSTLKSKLPTYHRLKITQSLTCINDSLCKITLALEVRIWRVKVQYVEHVVYDTFRASSPNKQTKSVLILYSQQAIENCIGPKWDYTKWSVQENVC